ncbi:phosphoenolpyruvate carboxylase [Ornithinimicrobium sp. Y1847]|uniref:phosphoenolpyruvate carboxylase n=1 Tax=Ornithinimicrobium sp. Y1847 TaxID=3405419 RepID=UPI003B682B49
MEGLTRDLELLTALHDQVLEEGGQGELAAVLRRHGGDLDHDDLDHDDLVSDAGPEEVAALTRAMTVRLHLANLADERDRARSLRREDGEHGGTLESGDIAPAVAAVGDGARDRLAAMRLHPVLTAHPTEARRRAVTGSLRRIAEQLDRYVDPQSGATEQAFARRRMLEDIDILQRTSTLRTTRPEPFDEVKTVLSIFDTTVFRAVPRFQRAVENALEGDALGGDALGNDAPDTQPEHLPSLIRYGSWVGGDRDGNPHVTAAVTRRTMDAQAAVALRTLQANVERVARTLTMDEQTTPASGALREALANDAVILPTEFAEIAKDSPAELHRQKLLVSALRLGATADGVSGTAYQGPEELLADLHLVRDSLLAAGDRRSADGELQHLLWLVETFGFHLAELEVRQHSAVHEKALVELLGLAGVQDPAAAARDAKLLDGLATDGWPVAVTDVSPPTKEVLDTIRVMSFLQGRWGSGCCGRYVVSFSQSAAHLAAVRALARLAVGDRPLRLDVVPLFETGEDLRGAQDTLEEWLTLPSTQAWLADRERRVEIMMGYSDSAKDVGPAAATITLHRAQGELTDWAHRHGIELTLFHGRGGSLGRGGGPLHRAITAQPTGSVDGRFKVTEQGEVIYARYADVQLAQQHLERVASAVLLADSPEVVAARDAAAERYADLGERLEEVSRTAYRDLMDTDGIADLIATASPLDSLGDLRLGSRPARRGGTSGRSLDDLRAIPWVFAWSMTRVNLPGWYGLGTALAAEEDREQLRAAYREWPMFASLMDVAEMSLAKSHEELAARFLELGGRPDLTERIIAELRLSREQVLDVLGQDTLLQHKPHLRTAVELRRPAIDALSRLQLRCLTELDADGAREDEGHPWHRPLLLTINGMAAGLQNTG